MSWITPVTTWITGNGIGLSDLNRIEGNLKYLREETATFNGIKTFTSNPVIGQGSGGSTPRNNIDYALGGYGNPGNWNNNSNGDKINIWNNGIDVDTRIGMSLTDGLWIKAMGATGENAFAIHGSALSSGAPNRLFTVSKTGVVSINQSLNVNTINEFTATAGVTIDGVLLKDNTIVTGAGANTFNTPVNNISAQTGDVTQPDYLSFGTSFSSTKTRDKLKVFIFNDGGTQKAGFGVGAGGEVTYHSNSSHEFYVGNAAAGVISPTLANFVGRIIIGSESDKGEISQIGNPLLTSNNLTRYRITGDGVGVVGQEFAQIGMYNSDRSGAANPFAIKAYRGSTNFGVGAKIYTNDASNVAQLALEFDESGEMLFKKQAYFLDSVDVSGTINPTTTPVKGFWTIYASTEFVIPRGNYHIAFTTSGATHVSVRMLCSDGVWSQIANSSSAGSYDYGVFVSSSGSDYKIVPHATATDVIVYYNKQ